jgi:hypothetical protein
MEIWKEIDEYEQYQISSYGNVKGQKGQLLKPGLGKTGYYVVGLHNKTYNVHKLVAKAFIPNPQRLPEVNHKDLNKQNNHVDNLEWTDRKGNNDHWIEIVGRDALVRPNYGDDNGMAHPSEIVNAVKQEYAKGNVSYSDLANKYNVTKSSIHNWIKGHYRKKG